MIEQGSTDYYTYINDSSTDSKDSGTITTSTSSNDNSLNISNTKERAPRTGGKLNYIPYIILVAIILGGLVFYVWRDKLHKNTY